MKNFSLTVLICLIVYSIIVSVIAIRTKRLTTGLKDYTTGGGIYSGFIIGFTVFAGRLSASTYLGAPALAYAFGWAGLYYWGPILLAALLITMFVFPRIHRLGREFNAYTPMEIIAQRFQSKGIQAVYSLLVFVVLTLILIGEVKGTGVILSQFLGTPIILGCVIGAAIVFGYSLTGGRHAGIYNDVFQGTIMILMAVIMVPYIIHQAHGLSNINSALQQQNPILVAFTNPPAYSLAIILVMPFFWLINYHVQPYSIHMAMTLKTKKEVSRVLIIEYLGYVTAILWSLGFGLGGRVLFPNLKAADTVVVVVIKNVISSPILQGLFVVGIWAAIMSTCNGVLLTGASSIANDIYRFVLKKKDNTSPDADDKKPVLVMRVTMFVMVAIALLVNFIHMPTFISFAVYRGFGLMMASSAGLFIGALWWKRATRAGAWSSLIAGPLAYLIIHNIVQDPGYFITGVLASIVSIFMLVVVSFSTKSHSLKRADPLPAPEGT